MLNDIPRLKESGTYFAYLTVGQKGTPPSCLEKERANLNDPKEATASMENLDEILSILRHELGNPVHSLKITLGVLRENVDQFDEQKIRDYLDRGAKLLARQEKLIEAMKFYSRFSAKKEGQIPFARVRKQLMAGLLSKVEGQSIEVAETLEPGPCVIQADPIALGQVITNVLDNAVEALEGRAGAEIQVRGERVGDSVVVVIKDNGTGIRESDMGKIFVPLFTTKPGKMGMGLPVSQKLLSTMGGRMEIQSRFGEGTEARLWLKAAGGRQGETG